VGLPPRYPLYSVKLNRFCNCSLPENLTITQRISAAVDDLTISGRQAECLCSDHTLGKMCNEIIKESRWKLLKHKKQRVMSDQQTYTDTDTRTEDKTTWQLTALQLVHTNDTDNPAPAAGWFFLALNGILSTQTAAISCLTQIQWIGLSSVLRPCQHSTGYMGDGFYRPKDPTNSTEGTNSTQTNQTHNKQRWTQWSITLSWQYEWQNVAPATFRRRLFVKTMITV